MSNTVNFKFGNTLEGKTVEAGDLIAINNGMLESGDGVTVASKYGSIYRGDKILGTSKADELVTTDEIVIAGGPMEALMLKVFKDGKIPAGTSMHDFLKLMACTDTYPTTASVDGTFKTTLSAPSISADKSNNAVVELGSTVTVNEIVAKATGVSKTNSSVSGLTYGYKTVLGGDVIADTSITKEWSYNVVASDVYKLTASTSGFTGLTNTSAENSANSSCKLPSQTLTVALGANTLTVTESGVGYNASIEGIDPVYIVSNIGSTSADHMTEKVAADEVTSTPSNSEASFKVTGVYPVYNNISGSTLQSDVVNKLTLANTTSFEISFPAETAANKIAFAYPANRTVTVQVYNTMSNKYESYGGEYTDVAEEEKRTINGIDVQYNVWTRVAENANDAVKFKFTLSKSTSVA